MSYPGAPDPQDPWATNPSTPSQGDGDPYASSAPSTSGDPYSSAAPAAGGAGSMYGSTYPGAPTYGQPDATSASTTPPSPYRAPAPEYGAGSPYSAPAGVYNAPTGGYGAPNGYVAAPTYGAGAYAAVAPKTNVMALVSLIASCSALAFGITALVGIICGHISLSQIKRTGEGGRGMAIAGLVIGYVLVGLFLLVVALIIFAVAMSESSRPY